MTQRALIIGASGGIGRALVAHYETLGWEVIGLSRSQSGLDITDEQSVRSALEVLTGVFEVIVVATGALEIDGASPEKSLKQITPKAMMDQFALNTIGPMLCLKHAARLLPKDRTAVMAVLSARVGSIGDNRMGGWHSYRAAKAAVNQIIRGAAIEIARSHKHAVVTALHPGTVKTPFTQKYVGRHPAVEPQEAAAHLAQVMAGLEPSQTGQFFDWAGKVVPW